MKIILFTDIVGSTEIYDRIGSQKALELVKKQEDVLFPLITQFGGRIIKTIGDSIMALFSLPDSAVQSAIEMQKQLNFKRQIKGKEFLLIRISLHYGAIIELEDDVFGDTVNVASRLQSLAGANQIIISHDLHNVCSNFIKEKSRFCGSYLLKGKKEKVEIFQITWKGDFSEYTILLPLNLTFNIFFKPIFNLPVEGICLSRGGFESYAKNKNLRYTFDEINLNKIQLKFINNLLNVPLYIYLYDDDLWKFPNDDFYQENMFEIFREADKYRIINFATSPTGKALGYSRNKALFSTLSAYSKYLQLTSTKIEPSIHNLFWESSSMAFSTYELNTFSDQLNNYLNKIDFFHRFYYSDKITYNRLNVSEYCEIYTFQLKRKF